MEITISNSMLSHYLRLLIKITPSNPQLDVLNYALFRVKGGELTISATDLEITAIVNCRAKASADGEFLLPARTLFDITDKLTNVDVTLRTDPDFVSITAESFKSRIPTMRAVDFPTMPQPEGAAFTLPAKSLAYLIDRVAYAVPDKPQQYTVNGALLEFNPLTLVSVDGKRLSLATDSFTNKESGEGVVIPHKALDVLNEYCADAETVEFSRSGNHLFFKIDDQLLVTRIIDGKFPNYRPIIPQDCSTVIRASRPFLAAALRRVGVLSEESKAVDFAFHPNLLRLTAQSRVGEAAEDMPVTYEGAPVKICTNGKFVLDFLERAIGSEITIGLKDDVRAMLLQDSGNFLNVVTILRQ